MFKFKWFFSAALIFLVTTYMYLFLSVMNKPNHCPPVPPSGSALGENNESARQEELRKPEVAIQVSNYSLLGYSHHVLQRRAIRLTRESRNLMQAKLREWRKIKSLPDTFVKDVDAVLAVFSELTDLLEVNVEGLARVNGAGTAQRVALQRLTDALNSELDKLQNPKNCTKSKHLLMNINKSCGFGCQLHHAAHCFRLAVATNRVLHLITDEYSYSKNGFFSVFRPLTSCPSVKTGANGNPITWGSPGFENADYVYCPIVEQFHEIPQYAPPAVPTSIADALAHLHGAPAIWFSGHLLAYIMRLKEGQVSESVEKVVSMVRGTPDTSPVVGVHIRRTDKIKSEAEFHKLDEYMVYVDRYFDKLDAERLMRSRHEEWRGDDCPQLKTPITRRVFIATDDPEVIAEARRSYPSSPSEGKPRYEFIGDVKRAQSASLATRYTHESLLAVITDVVALSHTDYIVCTFSSQICRLAYELMQTRPMQLGDASTRAQSLDDGYYYGGQQTWYQAAIVDDKEAGIEVGDLVATLGNHWNGYARIIPTKSKRELVLPAYRFEDRLLKVDFALQVNVSVS
uniref:GT23 domain-containing protein n=1 Tax=Mesocestoides corti TaxID=53468 RepID=A0A5K3EQW1_MESCO